MALAEVLKQYSGIGNLKGDCEYGNGHINDTYLLEYDNRKVILQKVNKSIFKEPKKLMENIYLVTSFLKDKIIKRGGDYTRETLNLIDTDDGNYFYEDSEGDIWRAYDFIRDTVCYEKVESTNEFYESGLAFGNFQNLLADFPVDKLFEVIKDFHNTQKRYETFINGVCEDPLKRAADVKSEIDFFESREKYTKIFNEALENKEISLRVTHNDTKLNNILFDKHTKKALCVIDLDTIMPGVADFDFGDAIRFGANKGLEDEPDLSKVGLDIELFEAFTKGFLKSCGKSLNKREIELLPMAAIVMTYECGIRFLGDYIAGDKYFKISRKNHNLDRARTQMKLISDMESNMDEMKKIVEKYIQ